MGLYFELNPDNLLKKIVKTFSIEKGTEGKNSPDEIFLTCDLFSLAKL